MIYVVSGQLDVREGDESATVRAGQVVGVRSDSTAVLAAAGATSALYFAREILDEPPVLQGM